MKLELTLPSTPGFLHVFPGLDIIALVLLFPLLGSSFVRQAGMEVMVHESPWRYQQMDSPVVVTLGVGDDNPMWINKNQVPIADLESEINEKPKMTGTVDLEYYKEKKSLLEAELNRTLDRLREATKNKDPKAKKNATDEMRKISAEIYDLTNELKKKNEGELPEGWWEKK